LEYENKENLIFADNTRIRQLMFNLLSNAIKFTPDGGKVGIKSCEIGDEIQITVWDTGIGIADDNIKLLFTPFKQIENVYVKRFAGTGLGLYLCKKIVDLHGGKIWVESILNQGSKFIFTIPFKKTIQQKLFDIIFIGLEKAGKSAIISKLLENVELSTYLPTTNEISHQIKIANNLWNIHDFPGTERSRYLWRKYYNSANLIIFIIDLADKDRFYEVKKEINQIFDELGKKNIPLLIIFNKIDLIKANLNMKDAKQLLTYQQSDRKIIFFNTSVKIPESIEKLKRTIASILESIKN
jgi:small GTP-binding protein